jgi:hypothetical protein
MLDLDVYRYMLPRALITVGISQEDSKDRTKENRESYWELDGGYEWEGGDDDGGSG